MTSSAGASRRTRLAVLGSPIAHSRSPELHRAAYGVLGLDLSFERVEVDESGFEAFWAGLDDTWRGFAVTMPLKRVVSGVLDRVDAVARRAGAVNTVLLADDGAHGFNTDVYGIRMALGELGVARPASAAVLGAGATAASVLVALAESGTESVRLVVRSPERAAAARGLGERLGLGVSVGTFADPLEAGLDAVVSTLPGGVALSRAQLEALAPAALRFRAPLLDIAYGSPSALVAAWEASGGRAATGLGMLLHQAVQQVRIVVGGDPAVTLPEEPEVVAAMRAAIGA